MLSLSRARAGDSPLSLLVTHRAAVAGAVTMLTCAALVLCLPRLRFESGFRDMFLESAAAYNSSSPQAHFPEHTELAVLVEGDVLASAHRERILALEQALARLEIDTEDPVRATGSRARYEDVPGSSERVAFERIESPFDRPRFATEQAGRIVARSGAQTGDRRSAQESGALEQTTRPALVDAAGRHAAILLAAPPMTDAQSAKLCNAVKATLERFSTPELHFSAIGIPVLNADLTALLMRDMGRLFGLGLLAAVVILAIAFRHPLAVVAPLVVIALSTVWTFAMMAACGVAVTLVMLYLPAFLTCVAVGDSVHIQNSYHHLRKAGRAREEAITGALRSTSRPIVYTALTTCCGLLGLCAASTKALRQLGVFASVGVTFAMLFSFLVVPIALSFHRGRTFGVEARETAYAPDRLHRFLLRASALTAPQRARGRVRLAFVMALLVGLFVWAIAGVTRLRVQHDTLDWLPRDSALRASAQRFDRFLGGTLPMTLVIASDRGAFAHDAAFLARVEHLRQQLLAFDDGRGGAKLVTSAGSVGLALDELSKVASEHGLALTRPWNDGEVSDLFTLLEIVEPTALRDWMSLDSQQTVLRLQLRWTDATAYEPFLAHARAAVTKTFGSNTRCRFVGPGYEMVAWLSSLLNDLRGSFLLAFLLEATTLAIFLRTIRLSLIAMLPNLLPVLVVLALMEVFGMRVDIHTLLLAPIALAVVTDDTAHFMHSVRQRISTTGNVEHALTETIRDVGRSLVINGATLTAGFGVYLAASMQSMQKLALLVMLTIVLSLLADLVFTPALVRITFRRYGRVLAQSA